ncbi:MAG: hypothetical protein WCS37_00035 [Chloroflexota bacterium]|nr:hypothetical protein [Chloroflexota bacterium]
MQRLPSKQSNSGTPAVAGWVARYIHPACFDEATHARTLYSGSIGSTGTWSRFTVMRSTLQTKNWRQATVASQNTRKEQKPNRV